MVSGKKTRYLRYAASLPPKADPPARIPRRHHAEGDAPPPELGQHIYAYYHVRTNQVVYSLRHTLRSAPALRQLPDLGANNTPAALRKDLWAPLFCVTLPFAHQGLNAFRMLRQYRRLHEISWTPSAALSRSYTQEEIKVMQEKLDERGGGKRETVYDIIKRKKRKLRVKGVTDQRANSVADLAAVLLQQKNIGAEAELQTQKRQEQERRQEVDQMLALAKAARNGAVERLAQDIEVLQQGLDEPKLLEGQSSVSSVGSELFKARAQLSRMEFARKAVTEAEIDAPMEKPTRDTEQQSTAVEEEAAAKGLTKAQRAHFLAKLPSFPVHQPGHMPKRGKVLQETRRAATPSYTTQGVTVKWTDIRDASFAKTWPKGVSHKPMGLSRYTAPRADAHAALSIAALRFKSRDPAKMSPLLTPDRPTLAKWVGTAKAEQFLTQQDEEWKRSGGAKRVKREILAEVHRRAVQRGDLPSGKGGAGSRMKQVAT